MNSYPGQKTRMRTTVKIIIAGSSLFALATGFFLYMNFSNVIESNAAAQPFLIPDMNHNVECFVPVTQTMAMPPAAKGTEIIKYRLAKNISH